MSQALKQSQNKRGAKRGRSKVVELGIEKEKELFSAGLDSDRESDSTLSATSESSVGCSSPIVKFVYVRQFVTRGGC